MGLGVRDWGIRWVDVIEIIMKMQEKKSEWGSIQEGGCGEGLVQGERV